MELRKSFRGLTNPKMLPPPLYEHISVRVTRIQKTIQTCFETLLSFRRVWNPDNSTWTIELLLANRTWAPELLKSWMVRVNQEVISHYYGLRDSAIPSHIAADRHRLTAQFSHTFPPRMTFRTQPLVSYYMVAHVLQRMVNLLHAFEMYTTDTCVYKRSPARERSGSKGNCTTQS